MLKLIVFARMFHKFQDDDGKIPACTFSHIFLFSKLIIFTSFYGTWVSRWVGVPFNLVMMVAVAEFEFQKIIDS